MSIRVQSFAALLPQGIAGPLGLRPWDEGQAGPGDVRRDQVLDKPYPAFGKLMLADRLAFAAASVALAGRQIANKDSSAITLGISAGSLSTDMRYMESVIAGFPSPAIFSATLPSSAIADIAIYYGLKGPNRVVAGNGASGLTALELAVSLLRTGKASTVLTLCVNAVETQDATSPLVGGTAAASNAFALLLSLQPDNTGTAMRLSASFSPAAKEGAPARDELYFTELIRLVREQKGGIIEAVSCDVAVTLSLAKEE
jgi:Beta-ketoacyl synthase, N-terminal domain